MIERMQVTDGPSGQPSKVEIAAEAEYEVKLYDDEDGQTWIQFREADQWTEPRCLNEFIRDVWIGL